MLVDMTEEKGCKQQIVFDGSKMPAKLLAGFFNAWPQTPLANRKRHGSTKHRPPGKEMGEKTRCQVYSIVAVRWLRIGHRPFTVDGGLDSNGHVYMVTPESSKSVIF